MAKILIFDIETRPNLAYVWRFFKENISPKQVVEYSKIMSFAAKWLDSDEVFYFSSNDLSEKQLIKELFKLIDKADIVVAHNGKKFDLGKIKARALVHGLKPPSPVKIVDTLISARNEFMFESNSLEGIADALKCKSRKGGHKKFPGFELWLECLKNNPEAWEELKLYNIQDVYTLEEVYLKMRPWISNHPNVGLMDEGVNTACPKCGSTHVHFRGYVKLVASQYRKFQCQECGGWGRLRTNVLPKERREGLAANIAG
jgi:predicted RNA-binding Zn-ribbon protein involved in translation (DUF1610 family)